MTKHRERQPLHLRPGISRRLGQFLILTHGTAAVAALLLPIPWYARAGLIGVLAADLGYQAGRHLVRRLPWAVCEAVWESDGSWMLTLSSGEQREARLLSTSFVSVPLIVLNFRCGRWRRCSLVLPRDSLDPDLLRRLRVRLRLTGSPVSSVSDAAA
jgi:toxin CptA